MVFINPQWQGSGLTNQLAAGAETLKRYFKGTDLIEIPLSTKGTETVDNIKCFHPVLEQAISFKSVVEKTKPARMTTIGGDCGIEIIPISYLNKIYDGNLGIVWIDAHPDLNTPESSPSKTFHGMPLRTLLGEGHPQILKLLFSTIEVSQVCTVGLRDIDPPEQDYITKHGVAGIANCDLSAIRDRLGNVSKLYIHLDLDVLDQDEYPFSLFPSGNGLSIDAVAKLINDLKKNYEVVGICITESVATTMEQLQPLQPILDEIVL